MKKRSGKKAGKSRGTRVRRKDSRSQVPAKIAVVLVGFMGAGKTSVGRALGQRLNWIFEDLDSRIERRENRSVAEIFRDSGEGEFRRAEREALSSALQESGFGIAKIIALGGGAFAQPENAKLIQAAKVATVFLDAPVEELWKRCCAQAIESAAERPLLRSREEFQRLYEERLKSYREAPFMVQTGSRTVDEIAAEIEKKVGLKRIAMRTEQGEVE